MCWGLIKLKLISKLISNIKEFINTIFLLFSSIILFFTRWYTGGTIVLDNTVKQIVFTGIGGLQVVGLAGIGLGSIVSIIFLSLGLPYDLITGIHGQVLTLVYIRELGPLLTALIVISRSGTAITTEIGNMNANKEFDSLTSMGIDVVHYVISPRIIGTVLAMISLNIYFCFLSVIVSAVIFNFNDISYNVFFSNFFNSLEFKNIFLSFLKSVGFGFIISSISCYQGYAKRITYIDVPKIITKSTGQCIVWCFLYYAFVTILSYI